MRTKNIAAFEKLLDKVKPWIERFFAALDAALDAALEFTSVESYKEHLKSLDDGALRTHLRILIRTMNSITPEDQHYERTKHLPLDEPVTSESPRVFDLYVRQQEIKAQLEALQKEKYANREILRSLPHAHVYEFISVDRCSREQLLHRFQCTICQQIKECMCDMCVQDPIYA